MEIVRGWSQTSDLSVKFRQARPLLGYLEFCHLTSAQHISETNGVTNTLLLDQAGKGIDY